MKNKKLTKLKTLTRKDLKNVSGGLGKCTGGFPIFEYHTYDGNGNPVTTGEDDGGWIIVGYTPKVC